MLLPFHYRVWTTDILVLLQIGPGLDLSAGSRDTTDNAHIPVSTDVSGGQTEEGKRFQSDQDLRRTILQTYALGFLSKRGS